MNYDQFLFYEQSILSDVAEDLSDSNAALCCKLQETSSISVECKPPTYREYGLYKIWSDVDILLWPWFELINDP